MWMVVLLEFIWTCIISVLSVTGLIVWLAAGLTLYRISDYRHERRKQKCRNTVSQDL